MTVSFRDIIFLFWIPFIRTLCIYSHTFVNLIDDELVTCEPDDLLQS
jgi:hypothetical protein